MEQIVDVPIPQNVKERTEIFKISTQDKNKQHSVEPSKLLLFHSLTRQVANTPVQHFVNTVEVEIPQFGAETGENPFAKVKGLITEFISRLQGETSSGTSKSTGKEEDLEADTGKHSSKLEAAISRSTVLNGEITTLQLGNADGHHACR